MKSVALLTGLLASTVTAHMQMSQPYPIRSPLNPNATGQVDYSYTNPLDPSGSDFPCKGYANDKFVSQATYQPGQQYEMKLEGSATHEGGSCQLSLTYDRGKTFKVIESMLGSCPIPKNYSFTVPSDAPSGQALLAWTWFNKIGNREMYMNCAMVTIGGSSNGKETPAKAPANNNHVEAQKAKAPAPNMPEHKMGDKHTAEMQDKEHAHEAHALMEHASHQNKQRGMTDSAGQKKTLAFDSLPPIFVANVDQVGHCVTIEGTVVNFPMPGDNVMGTADGKGYKCADNAPFLGASGSTNQSTASTSGNNSSNQDSSNQDTSCSNTKDQNMPRIASAFGNPRADPRIVSTEASTNNEFRNYVGGWSCVSGEIMCSPDGWSWAVCSNGRPIFMGPVAAGMVCRLGQMVRAQW